MALIDDVKRICNRLAPQGWGDLLAQHGLNITAANLADELSKKLTNIVRSARGFEDFALEGERGIEPGHPARSLLYHALASPNVLTGINGSDLKEFPTLAELDTIENYVFGVRPPTIDELRVRAQNLPLAIVVFASEYRPASDTCHKKHADLVFSRTGVSRVGTVEPLYDARRRGFLPFVEGDAHAIRVSPARYSVYIAAQKEGSRANFCPMRFRSSTDAEIEDNINDSSRKFWLPIHKLFPGPECLKGLSQDLQVKFVAHHFNEKIRRIHVELGKSFNTGANIQDLDKPPFRFTEGIAELSTKPEHGPGLLAPVPHRRLVEPAEFQGKPLTFKFPAGKPFLSSSLSISGKTNGARHAPEFVNVRHRIEANGTQTDLNTKQNVIAEVKAGNYNALHFVDFTGDGWIEVSCPPLTGPGASLTGPLPAYSLITAPDFFPTCDQRELMEWSTTLPPAISQDIWPQRQPRTLSDQRFAANLQLPGGPFIKTDKTMTAIVSLFGEISKQQTNAKPADALRHSPLPDDAAGVFQPGWDVSRDTLPDQTVHLAAYGLGSPFVEDAKLCAALSAFWPAVAPDATRTMEPGLTPITASPLTDEEIGETGNLPWDGIPGPRIINVGGERLAEYVSFAHADYVQSALDGKFSNLLTSHIGIDEYKRRVLAMVFVYSAVGLNKTDWLVLSFRRVTPGDAELVQAQQQAQTTLSRQVYRFELFRKGSFVTSPADFHKRRVKITDLRILFAGPDINDPEKTRVLMKKENGKFIRV